MNPKQLIIQEINKFNRTNLNYDIDVLNEEFIEKNINNLDFRLSIKKYRDSSVAFSFVDKEKRTVLLTVTILIFDKSDFKQIHFWKLQNNILKKISLSDIDNEIGKYACTLGYAQNTPDFKNKYRITKFYITLINKLIEEEGIFTYLEPTGKEELENFLVEYEEIDCHNNYFNSENIGEVRTISKPAEKLAKPLNLIKVNNLYHLYTLGPVYFSKDIKRL